MRFYVNDVFAVFLSIRDTKRFNCITLNTCFIVTPNEVGDGSDSHRRTCQR